jgi:hypothetical protein
MGLLDDLQARAEEIKAEERARSAELAARDQYYQETLKPVMLLARNYLGEVIGNLNVIQPDIRPRYPLDPASKVGISLTQADYRLDFDNPDDPHQLDIRCTCTLEQPLEMRVSGPAAVKRQTDLLESYKFFYHRKDERGQRHNVTAATFFLEGPVRVHIRLLADAAERCIHILLRNIEEQPVQRYRFAPQQVDQGLLERLGRVLIREETTLVKVEVNAEVREQLRQRIERDKRAREEDLASAMAARDEELASLQRAGLGNRTKTAVAAGKERLLRLTGRRK